MGQSASGNSFPRIANAPESARMDWSAFTKGYFLNRETLVVVLLLIDASVPPQKIDLDWKRPHENIKKFLELMRENFREHPAWIMTSSRNTGLGRDELLLHLSQLRNFWDN
ncbi:hypothetical protein CsSME_00025258 [Camellia sinensis var. sinensis]